MGRLSSAERHWKSRLEDQTLPVEEHNKAAQEIEKIKRRHARSKVRARYKKWAAALADDPRPLWYPRDGSYSEYPEKLSAWEKRHPEGDEEVPAVAPVAKFEASKPALVVAAPPIEFVYVDPVTLFESKPAPASKPVPAPKPPVPVQREPREGVSGYFYKEVFWSLSIDERNAKMLRVNRDLALKMEWENITAAMRAPKEVLTPLSESEKAKAFAPPTQRPQNRVFATGQIQTIDASRAPFQPTMANGDGGISIEPDKRGWLPDINPLSLTPSR